MGGKFDKFKMLTLKKGGKFEKKERNVMCISPETATVAALELSCWWKPAACNRCCVRQR